MPRGFRRLPGLAALLSLAGLLACEPAAPSPASARLSLEPDGAVHISEPAGCAQILTSGAPVSVKVVFQVQAVYPALNKGVAFTLDGGAEPYAVVQSAGPVALSGLAPGRHRIAACLVTKQGDAWVPSAGLARRSLGEGGCTCDAVTVDVALAGCSLTVPDPMTGDPECNPAAPAATCCVDENPCSVETCDTTGGTPTCAFQSVAPDCCLSNVDCPADQFCHQADDPTSNTDDALALNRCAPCSACPAAGATCPAVCGACPTCEAEGACGGGVCPNLEPPPEPLPEPPPDTAAPEPPDQAGDGEPVPETVETGAPEADAPPIDAPGYVVEISLGDATDEPLDGGSGACSLGLADRPATAGWLVMLALALALGARRTEVSAWGSRSGSSRSSRRRP